MRVKLTFHTDCRALSGLINFLLCMLMIIFPPVACMWVRLDFLSGCICGYIWSTLHSGCEIMGYFILYSLLCVHVCDILFLRRACGKIEPHVLGVHVG